MIIKDCMKKEVVFTHPDESILDAAKLMIKKHVDTLPVIDNEKKLIGIVRLRDLIDLNLPDFIDMIEQVDFVHDFGALEEHCPDPEILRTSIQKIMHEKVAVEETSGLLHAAALFREHQLHDIPVVDSMGILVGIASSVDVGVGILSAWHLSE